MIVATAGHIDHGKSTLVLALTGIDTDRLPEEKARGISIDLGFAHWAPPGHEPIGFIDVPGHERFIRNMLCGVCAIDHVLLVVAADDGVMPQTREHLSIVNLLGVSQGTVAITKIDRVPPARVAQVEAEVQQLLSGTRLAASPSIAVCAANGDGMDALRARLAATAALQGARAATGSLPRFVVDRVFTVPGSGTVVTGTVISGEFTAGDKVVVSPRGIEARIRKLQRHGKDAQRAITGQRCAINLAQVELAAIARGDWVVGPAAHAPTDRIDARISVLAGEAGPLKHWTPVHVHIGAADVPARVALRRGASIAPGTSAIAQLRLDRPVCAAHNDRLILRDQSAARTLGGGVVIDPCASTVRNTAARVAMLDALEQATPARSLHDLLACSARGVDLAWFARVFNVRGGEVQGLLPPGAAVIGPTPGTAFRAGWLDDLHTRAVEWLQGFHARHPKLPGADAAALQRDVARWAGADLFLEILRLLTNRGRIALQGPSVRLASHDATGNPADLLLWQKIFPMIEHAGAQIPSVRELAADAHMPLQQLRDFLHRKSASGELVKVTPERFALRSTLSMLAAKARETARIAPDGIFTAAQYRDMLGTGRGLAIEILECLDKHGVTQRHGAGRRHTGNEFNT